MYRQRSTRASERERETDSGIHGKSPGRWRTEDHYEAETDRICSLESAIDTLKEMAISHLLFIHVTMDERISGWTYRDHNVPSKLVSLH